MSGTLTLTAGAQELAAQYNVNVEALSQQIEGSVRWQKADMLNYLVSVGALDPSAAPVAPVAPDVVSAASTVEPSVEFSSQEAAVASLPVPDVTTAAVGDSASAEVVAGPLHVSTEGTDPIIADLITLDSSDAAVLSAGPSVSSADINFVNEFDALLAPEKSAVVSSSQFARAHYDGPTNSAFDKQVEDAVSAYAKAPVGSRVSIPWGQRALAVALTKTDAWVIADNIYDKATCNYTLVVQKVA